MGVAGGIMGYIHPIDLSFFLGIIALTLAYIAGSITIL